MVAGLQLVPGGSSAAAAAPRGIGGCRGAGFRSVHSTSVASAGVVSAAAGNCGASALGPTAACILRSGVITKAGWTKSYSPPFHAVIQKCGFATSRPVLKLLPHQYTCNYNRATAPCSARGDSCLRPLATKPPPMPASNGGRLPYCTAPTTVRRRRGVRVGSATAPNSAALSSSDRASVGSSWDEGGSGAEGGSGSSTGGSSRRVDELVLTTRDEDTIASIVTGMSHGSVAIIRLSGTDAVPIASKVFRPGGRFRFDWQPETHRVYYGTAVDGDERLLDEVLLLTMLSPRSYTAEDVIELHCHGGGVCASRVLRAAIEAGARLAKPGEFTLRAFLNGRLDLSQAEAVSELVSARTPAAADSALAGLQGGVGGMVSELRSRCLDVLAELEARLDFDEDLPPIDVPELRRKIEGIQEGIERALRTARTGNLLRSGLQVAIVGRPNVGKSSLLNAWTNSDRAIVTDVAGTTRDVLEATLSVGGVPVTLLDTAGIRHSEDVVERIGVERSQAAAAAADIVIMVIDGAVGWTDADADIFRALWGEGPGTAGCKVKGAALLVANKDDLRGSDAAVGNLAGAGASSNESKEQQQQQQQGARSRLPAAAGELPLPLLARQTFAGVVRTSASERRGLEALDQELLILAGAPQLASGGVSWSVNERQAEALVRSHEALMRLSDSVTGGLPLDFWTIDLRAALLALGEVSGDEVAEEVLDTVFSRFCIGK